MGIERLVYVIPKFQAAAHGVSVLGLIDHSKEKRARHKWALPMTILKPHEAPRQGARRALCEHTGVCVPMDRDSLVLLATHYADSDIIGETDSATYLAREPASGWQTDRMTRIPTPALPQPADCPPYMQRAIAQFIIYDTNMAINAFIKWSDEWRWLAQDIYSAIDPHQ